MIPPRRSGLRAAVVGLAAAATAQAASPNILVILADDLGIGDVSCYNAQSAWQTPRMDQLAREGIRFTDAHAASALCTPSRYALLTGRYSWRSRLKHSVLSGYEASLIEPGRLTLPGFLRAHGYTTAMFGKWHLGLDWKRRGPLIEDVDFGAPFGGGPTAHGFDQFLGIAASLDMPPYVWLANDRVATPPTATVGDSEPPKLWRAGPIASDFQMEGVEPRLIEETTAFLKSRRAASAPFFAYVALPAPHTPLLPTPEFRGATHTNDYGDFVRQVDAHVGRLLDVLDETGLAANTLVVVTSDNGFAPAAGITELQALHHDPSGGYRGYKSDLFEGGHRIPFIVRWPKNSPAALASNALVCQVDLFATFAALLGETLPANAAEDSVSLLPVLRGEKVAAPPRTFLVDHSGDGRFAIREGKWKLLLWPGSGGWSSPTDHPSRWLKVPATNLSTLPKYQLYDLSVDPAEVHNVADAHPDVVKRLGQMMRRYIEDGRSTPGAPQPVSLGNWPQLEWFRDFNP